MATNVGNKLYAWEYNGTTVYTNTLTITDSSTIYSNTGGTVIYNINGQEVGYVISHTNNTITKPNVAGGSN